MTSRQSPSIKDDASRSLKREEALHRSLRECTTRRLTHFNPCHVSQAQSVPMLTSRVQWNNSSSASEDTFRRDRDYSMKDAGTDGRGTSLSPVLSEIDELDPSDDEHLRPNDLPCTGVTATSCLCPRTRPSPSCSDSSDTERRQPNFPGNRDIIDSCCPSASPSPPTQHSTDLETPSPVSDVVDCWPSSNTNPSTSLDLQLHASENHLLRGDRLARVSSWRVESAPRSKHDNYSDPYPRYFTGSRHSSVRSSYSHYSPSISSTSAPPSPPPILPPIHHLNATLPVNTGSTPGVMHWRFREPSDYRSLHRGPVDETDDSRSSTTSPQSLPPLLPHIKKMALIYPPSHPVPARAPVFALPPQPSLAAPTRNKNAWKEYAQLVSGPNEQTEFRCIWRVGYTGEATDHCGYTAKRHLVKRHIETRHLQFKDHICTYCGKAFPQRVSLMIHVNRHTGAKPHSCRYAGCDKTFSDPARRHKHMVEAHGYHPQGPRKRNRTVDSYHANANFETLAPWAARGENPERAATRA